MLDSEGNVIVGPTLDEDADRSVPILVDGQTVGYVAIARDGKLEWRRRQD